MFTQQARYTPTMVAIYRACLTKFMCCIFEVMVKKCRTTMLVNEMDISRTMFDGSFSID